MFGPLSLGCVLAAALAAAPAATPLDAPAMTADPAELLLFADAKPRPTGHDAEILLLEERISFDAQGRRTTTTRIILGSSCWTRRPSPSPRRPRRPARR